METKRNTTTFLHIGTIFGLLTLLLFICYSYFRSSDTPCNAFGWLLLDPPGLYQLDESQLLLILSSLCGLIFSLSFRAFMMYQLPKMMNEGTAVFVALKLLALLAALFYSFDQNLLFFFILNGLVVILSIFTYFIFSLLFKKLHLPFLIQIIPFFCFGYSVFSFLILALAPTFDPANIQMTSNFLELLFILYLGFLMWKLRKTV
ncbi:MAG: hypothetical protein IC227_05295 [Enterococcus lacertideformus]|uniref:Uncharacterized protein n=1 Tax=Enterococcus lacertideformus TaxID=2771493 RepID=A0A931B253_9ENTE|nr:hypothetical protein [Enterococcus lacertideformus]